MSRRMWLVMLEQGGRWTSRELADKFGLTPEKAESLTGFMVRSKIVKKVRSGKRKNGIAFAVTEGVMIPRDLMLSDLLRATDLRIWEGA